MTAQKTTRTLDFGALRGAIERRDPDALLGFYAEDADLRIENADLPDGKAFELKGRAQIERYLTAVCDQEVGRAVRGEAIYGERSVAFVETCRYSEDAPVSVRTTLEVEGGLILRQIDVVERSTGEDAVGGERSQLRRARIIGSGLSAKLLRKRRRALDRVGKTARPGQSKKREPKE